MSSVGTQVLYPLKRKLSMTRVRTFIHVASSVSVFSEGKTRISKIRVRSVIRTQTQNWIDGFRTGTIIKDRPFNVSSLSLLVLSERFTGDLLLSRTVNFFIIKHQQYITDSNRYYKYLLVSLCTDCPRCVNEGLEEGRGPLSVL